MTAPVDLIKRATRLALCALALAPSPAAAQTTVKAQVAASTPAWEKGIQPISPESYYHAIECGKQEGRAPACVFWDTGLCKNDDYTLAMYTPYKMVAYEVWRVIQNGQPAPQPSYQEAQRTRVTIGVTAARGTTNPITGVVVKRGGRTIEPTSRSIEGAGGRFTFDPAAFAATGAITIQLVGRSRTIACQVDQPTLARFR
jgi:hypothetical protein